MRAFLIVVGALALSACDNGGVTVEDMSAARAPLAAEIENLGFPCPSVIGTDANLIVCRVGTFNVRVYRLLGAGHIERVEPGGAP